jgi:dihydrofolate reductase
MQQSTRKLVVTENTTLDGVIDAAGDWFSVTDSEETDDVNAELREQMATEGALLVGRKTFESFREYWPNQKDDTTGVTEHLNRIPKYVVSSTMQDPEWENSTVLSGPLEDEVRKLKAKPGKEIGVTGSIQLVHALIAAGLVDEYRLFVYPVVLGDGARLFQDATRMPTLRLIEAKPFKSGVVLLTYRAG